MPWQMVVMIYLLVDFILIILLINTVMSYDLGATSYDIAFVFHANDS